MYVCVCVGGGGGGGDGVLACKNLYLKNLNKICFMHNLLLN